MSLKQKIPQIMKSINANAHFFDTNERIFNILEGDLHTEVLARLREQLKSERAFAVAKNLIEPINLMRRVVDKMTKIYVTPVKRTTENLVDQELIDYYVKQMDLDAVFHDANFFFNGTRVTLIEPYLDGIEPQARVVPSHMFMPWTDDIVNPQRPTVIVKMMGDRQTDDGKESILFIYSSEEFIAVNQEGTVLPEFMMDNKGENPFGIIPSTYINQSKHLLIPRPDYDTLQIGTLTPLLLCKLNFAIEFQAHSIIYGIDIDTKNIEYNPNAFWVLNSTEEGKTPSVGQIKPQIDIIEVLTKIEKSMGMWLESKGIKAGSIGTLTSDSASSGVALMIQEADVTKASKEQQIHFTKAENSFWAVMKKVHNYWADTGKIAERRKFSDDFKVSVEYTEPKPVETSLDIIERQKILLELRLSSKKLALKEIYPKKTNEEIDNMIEEINKEDSLEGFMDAGQTSEIQSTDKQGIHSFTEKINSPRNN